MNFGFGATFNVNATSFSTSMQTSSYQQTTTVTSSSKSVTLETTLRTQYEEKIKAWESKFGEVQNLVQDLTKRLRTSESSIADILKKNEAEKNNLEFHIQRIRTERNEAREEVNALENELAKFRKEDTVQLKIMADFEIKISILEEKLFKYEEEKKIKLERMAEMEAKLAKAQNELAEEALDDAAMEEVIKKQKETITSMQKEIASWIEENARDDKQIAELENKVRQKDLEIASLAKQMKDLKEFYNDTTYILISNIHTHGTYIELNSKYDLMVIERTNLQSQLDGKNAIIKDLEGRIKSATEKYNALNKSFTDLRLSIEIYEKRELELKKSIDDYRMQYTLAQNEIAIKITKINALEKLLQSKDEKLNKYVEQIRERDTRINELKEQSKKSSEELDSTKKLLEQKLKEIMEWRKEDERDNSQIQELLNAIQRQNDVIKGWEEENRRDDLKIAQLEEKCKKYEAQIETLKDYFKTVKDRLREYAEYNMKFTIVDNKMTSASILKFKKEVEESSSYIQLKEKLSYQEMYAKELNNEINNYRNEIQQVIKEKNVWVTEYEKLKREMELQAKKFEAMNHVKVDFETRFQKSITSVEVEQTNFITANSKVESFKAELSTKRGEFEALFRTIEQSFFK